MKNQNWTGAIASNKTEESEDKKKTKRKQSEDDE